MESSLCFLSHSQYLYVQSGFTHVATFCYKPHYEVSLHFFKIMFETVCIWLVCRVDILGVGIPLFLSRWLFLGGGDGGCLFARPLGMSGGNVVNWILLVSWGGGGCIVRPPMSTVRQQVLCLLSAGFVGVFITR